MDGYHSNGAIRESQAGDNNKLIPIIALTANTMEQDRDKCIDAKINDYLSKPVDEDLLLEIFHKWLPEVDDSGNQNSNIPAHGK